MFKGHRPYKPSQFRSTRVFYVGCTNSSHFDSLNDDELRKVLRFASIGTHNTSGRYNYRCEHGLSVIIGARVGANPQAFAKMVFSRRSPFRRVTQGLVHTLRLHFANPLHLGVVSGVLELGNERDDDLADLALRVCAPDIRTIELTTATSRYEFRVDCASYPNYIAKYCTAATSLIIQGSDLKDKSRRIVRAFLHQFASSMHTLSISPSRKIDHSVRISGITIGHNLHNCQLKRFVYEGSFLMHLAPVWRSAGNTLTEINLTCHTIGGWLGVLEAISSSCRNLQSIELDNPLIPGSSVDERTYAEFLASYCGKLRHASLHSIDEELCSHIAACCVNLRCSFTEKRNQFRRFGALHRRLESLTLRITPVCSLTELEESMKRCNRLVSLDLYRKPDNARDLCKRIDAECLQHIFRAPMSNLEILHIRSVPENFNLAQVAKTTGLLKSIMLSFGYIAGADTFRRIVLANPNLETVELNEDSRRGWDDSARLCDKVIQCFLQCKKLSIFALQLGKSQMPHNEVMRTICVQLEDRAIRHQFKFIDGKYSGSEAL